MLYYHVASFPTPSAGRHARISEMPAWVAAPSIQSRRRNRGVATGSLSSWAPRSSTTLGNFWFSVSLLTQ